jgi:hypothetical protein
MAGTTGLEPAASAVTGQRSNQLNYVPTRQNRWDEKSGTGEDFTVRISQLATGNILTASSGTGKCGRNKEAEGRSQRIVLNEVDILFLFFLKLSFLLK